MRRLEAGPLLVTLGALLLVVSLFVDWYGEQTAWQTFEVWDLALTGLALAAATTAVGLISPGLALLDRRWLPVTVAAAGVVVAAQILDPPPAAAGLDPRTGAWLALGAALVLCLGAVLTFGRIELSLTVAGRDPRRHVAAVDARGEPDPPTGETLAVSDPSAPGARQPR